jgi:hypothetical protein
VATSAIRLAARLRLANRVDPPVNLIISNVPGPRQPLYLDGAPMKTYIPVSAVGEGMGLNVTVHSYLDELEFGIIACRELVPDTWHMLELHLAEIDVLLDAAGVSRDGDTERTTPPLPTSESDERPATKRATRTRAAARKRPAATPAKKAPARKTAAKQTTATKRAATKRAAKQPATKRATTKRAAKQPATKRAATKRAAKQPATKRATTKRTATKRASTRQRAAASD